MPFEIPWDNAVVTKYLSGASADDQNKFKGVANRLFANVQKTFTLADGQALLSGHMPENFFAKGASFLKDNLMDVKELGTTGYTIFKTLPEGVQKSLQGQVTKLITGHEPEGGIPPLPEGYQPPKEWAAALEAAERIAKTLREEQEKARTGAAKDAASGPMGFIWEILKMLLFSMVGLDMNGKSVDKEKETPAATTAATDKPKAETTKDAKVDEGAKTDKDAAKDEKTTDAKHGHGDHKHPKLPAGTKLPKVEVAKVDDQSTGAPTSAPIPKQVADKNAEDKTVKPANQRAS